MKKRLIAAALAAVTTLSATPFAFADAEKVEIAFNVGDSILSINGNKTEVETPYVTDSGTTLVPLRVITEAFGAQVDWNGETQEIALAYPDVNISLQIGNIIATVNDHTETLLEAPALSPNGVTMVPLRFISETFGATVGYDDATAAITVTKETLDELSTVTGTHEMKKTGDSYFKWSIDTPTQMKMTDRRLDGMSTTFTSDDGNSNIMIDVLPITEDTVTFDEEFAYIKNKLSSFTLTSAEKLTTPDDIQYMVVQAKDKTDIIDIRVYYTQAYKYMISSVIDTKDNTAIKDMILSVVDSFEINTIDNQTYDLSTVRYVGENQYREIKDETYKVSFSVLASYMISTTNTPENELYFYNPSKYSNGSIGFGVYSKTADLTAYSLAVKDSTSRTELFNPKFSTVSTVNEVRENSYKYTQTVSGSKSDDCHVVDTFFELGDYVYNFSITVNNPDELTLITDVLNSLKTEELDPSKIGKIMRNDSEDTPVTAKVGDYKFTLPATWKKIAGGNNLASYINDRTSSGISYSTYTDSAITVGSLSSVANSYLDYIDDKDKSTILDKIQYKTINKRRYAYFTYSIKSDDSEVNGTVYISCEKGAYHVFTLLQDDTFFNGSEANTFQAMLESFDKQ